MSKINENTAKCIFIVKSCFPDKFVIEDNETIHNIIIEPISKRQIEELFWNIFETKPIFNLDLVKDNNKYLKICFEIMLTDENSNTDDNEINSRIDLIFNKLITSFVFGSRHNSLPPFHYYLNFNIISFKDNPSKKCRVSLTSTKDLILNPKDIESIQEVHHKLTKGVGGLPNKRAFIQYSIMRFLDAYTNLSQGKHYYFIIVEEKVKLDLDFAIF